MAQVNSSKEQAIVEAYMKLRGCDIARCIGLLSGVINAINITDEMNIEGLKKVIQEVHTILNRDLQIHLNISDNEKETN